jgi:hypothetical protein
LLTFFDNLKKAFSQLLWRTFEHLFIFLNNFLTQMDQITEKEIKQLAKECLSKIKSDDLHRVRNDAKLRAVTTTKNYDEFK